MKEAAVWLIVFLTIFPLICYSGACAASSRKYSRVKPAAKYSVIIKKLIFYQEELAVLSSKISKEKKDVSDLKNKIETAKNKIKKLKNKIKKGDSLIKGLTIRIFLIHKEYSSARLSPFKNNADRFVIDFQLKTLLKKEEKELSKLVKRKNRFIKLKKYLKEEKDGLILAISSLSGSRNKLEGLIGGIGEYIKSVKIKSGSGNKIQNKKNRLLKRKVIKLIHNLNDSSKKDDIKFIIMR